MDVLLCYSKTKCDPCVQMSWQNEVTVLQWNKEQCWILFLFMLCRLNSPLYCGSLAPCRLVKHPPRFSSSTACVLSNNPYSDTKLHPSMWKNSEQWSITTWTVLWTKKSMPFLEDVICWTKCLASSAHWTVRRKPHWQRHRKRLHPPFQSVWSLSLALF